MTLALLTGCGTANLPENLAADQTTAPLAVLEGEELSPDGQFEVQIVGASNIVNGIQVPEKIQVVDQETGEVMWEDQGWGTQSVLWSPDSHYLALAYGACTWQAVHIIETDTWTVWISPCRRFTDSGAHCVATRPALGGLGEKFRHAGRRLCFDSDGWPGRR